MDPNSPIGRENIEKNGEQARRMVKELDRNMGGGLVQFLEDTRLGDDPRAVKFFGWLAQAIGERRVVSGFAGFADAAEMIRKVNEDGSHPYWHGDHPKHAQAVETMRKLYELLHGSEAI